MLKLFILSLLSREFVSQNEFQKTCNWATLYMGEKLSTAPGSPSYLNRIPVLVGTGEKPGPCIRTNIDGVREDYALACIPSSTGLTEKRLYKTSCLGAPYTFTMVDVMDGSISSNGWGSNPPQGALGDPSTYNCNARDNRQCQYARLTFEADDNPNCTFQGDWASVPLIAQQLQTTQINNQVGGNGGYSYALGDTGETYEYNVNCNGSAASFYGPQLESQTFTAYANLTGGCDVYTYGTSGNIVNTPFGRKSEPETGESTCNYFQYMGTDVIPSMINAAPTSQVSMPTCNPVTDACKRDDFSNKYPVVGSSSNQFKLSLLIALAIFGLQMI